MTSKLSNSFDSIKVYTDIQSMTGKGEEWLVDSSGEVRAVFIDGRLGCRLYLVDSSGEVTKAI